MIEGITQRRIDLSLTSDPPTGRRTDWRFLLPTPANGIFEHLVLLGGPPGLADRIVAAGWAQRISRAVPHEPSADAVVRLYDSGVDVQHAAACLLPGGSLYYEVDRRSWATFACTPERMVQAMRHAGLIPTGSYWAAPNFIACKRYLPLDAPEALRWYMQALFVAGTPFHRLLEFGAQALRRVSAKGFLRCVPCYALTACHGGNAAAPSVLGHPDLPSSLHQPALRPMVVTSGQDDGSRVGILPFAPGSLRPLAVVKVAGQPAFNSSTEREHDALVQLHRRLDPVMRRTIPQPLGMVRFGSLAVAVESCAPGQVMWASSGRWPAAVQQQIVDLRLAADWLGQFHQQIQISRSPWGESEHERWVERPFAAYADAFGVTEAERTLFGTARAVSKTLKGRPLPIVWQHHDFGPWNLYRDGGRLTVIDWELRDDQAHDRVGPAMYDLLYFVVQWHTVARRTYARSAELRGFYQLFLAPAARDVRTRAAQQVIAAYMAQFDIAPRFLPLLLVTTWVTRAVDRCDRRRLLGDAGGRRRASNRFVDYVALIAQHADPLFDSASGV